MSIAIEVKNLGKKYQIERTREVNKTLRDSLVREIKKLVKLVQGQKPVQREDFWALKDINFEVRKGEVLGIIGPNGAGKSTLLKILSRITPPTKGEIAIKGRVASLLEVGTGFHPELSGRENIYLNGAILGMGKQEIERKFNDIVEFSGIGKFLDTPVKRYSSGMSVRLAFAVAAHLEPEILLVDEVLAVGDVEFQRKCLGKMNEVVYESGRTILFVSHNMEAIQNLCERCILLQEGKISLIDRSDKVIQEYLSNYSTEGNTQLEQRKDRRGKGDIWFTDIKVMNQDNSTAIKSGDNLIIKIKYNSNFKEQINKVKISLVLYCNFNTPILRLKNTLTKDTINRIASRGEIICKTDKVPLDEGIYSFNIAIFSKNIKQDHITNAVNFPISQNYERYNFHENNKKGIGNLIVPHSFYQE